MNDPTIYLKNIEEIQDFWLAVKDMEDEDRKRKINEYKESIQDSRLKSAVTPCYFMMTINMQGSANRDDRVLLLSIIMSTYFSSVIFCQETPGHFGRDIVKCCGTSGYSYVINGNTAILWRTEDFESSTDGLSTTDRPIIQIRDKTEYTTELLSRIAMVKLTCRSSSETTETTELGESVLAVSWHGPHRGYGKTVEKPNAFKGLTNFLKEVCKKEKIPTFLIGGDFNLDTLGDELTLEKNVAVSVYELSPRQLAKSARTSRYIPHKDNFVFIYGKNITVSWTRPFEIEDPNASISDLTEEGHENIRSKMATSKVPQVEQALDHDPIVCVLEFFPANFRERNKETLEKKLCSSERELSCNNNNTISNGPIDETQLSKSSPNESIKVYKGQEEAKRLNHPRIRETHNSRREAVEIPEEFEGKETCLNSEMYMFLEKRKTAAEGINLKLSKTFLKTFYYTQKFGTFKNMETIKSVRSLLGKFQKLNQFEQTSLANLCPKTAIQAKDLIPSLEGKVDNEDLQQLLDDIKTIRSY